MWMLQRQEPSTYIGAVSVTCTDGTALPAIRYGFNGTDKPECSGNLLKAYNVSNPADGRFTYKFVSPKLVIKLQCKKFAGHAWHFSSDERSQVKLNIRAFSPRILPATLLSSIDLTSFDCILGDPKCPSNYKSNLNAEIYFKAFQAIHTTQTLA